MKINGISGTDANMQAGGLGVNAQMDSVSRSIQNQIAIAQKQLQDLSSNADMTLEEKMKKRQEIQQEIAALNQQLRQHQAEQRKEQQSKGASVDELLGGGQTAGKSGNKGSGLSLASMRAIITADSSMKQAKAQGSMATQADSSMKQAKAQGSMATQMEGRAGVLASEIKADKGRGASTEKKEEELADLQAKAQSATAAQASTLAYAGKVMEKAAKADAAAEPAKGKNGKADKNAKNDDASISVKEAEENAPGAESANARADTPAADVSVSDVSVSEAASAPDGTAVHTPIDVRL